MGCTGVKAIAIVKYHKPGTVRNARELALLRPECVPPGDRNKIIHKTITFNVLLGNTCDRK